MELIAAAAAELAKVDDKKKATQASELVTLAGERCDLGVSDTGEVFAVERDGPNVALHLRGGRSSLRAALAAAYHGRHDRAPSSSALADALSVIEGKAMRSDPVDLPVRVADVDGAVVLDLGTPDGRCVRVTPGRVDLLDRSPVTFRRSQLTLALPTPSTAGDVDQVLNLRNSTSVGQSDLHLIVAWLVAALCPKVPHPLLLLGGEQGTGKSTHASTIVRVVDPTSAPLRSMPRDDTTWAISAAGSWTVVLDNVSSIREWLSDALCRAVTGDAFVRRQLYTDSDVSVLAFRRCVVLTSIDAGALRGDLAERILPIDLERIDATERRTEADVLAAFDADHASILSALLQLLAQVLDVLPSIQLATLPRMADFARLLGAVDQVTGWHTLDDYLSRGVELFDDVVDADPLAAAVVELVEQRRHWSGSASDLLALLTPVDDIERRRLPRTWPKSAQALSGQLKRLAPALRAVGVTMNQGEGRARRHWFLTFTDSASETSSPASPAAHARQDRGAAGDDAVTMVTMVESTSSRPEASTGAAGDDGDARDDVVRPVSADDWFA